MTKEFYIQIACNELLNALTEIYNFRHYHVANEGKRSVQYLIKLKKMGFRAGVPDFIIEYPEGRLLYVELKNEKGKLTDSQKIWKIRSSDLKTPFFVVKGNTKQCLTELTEIIDQYVPRNRHRKRQENISAPGT